MDGQLRPQLVHLDEQVVDLLEELGLRLGTRGVLFVFPVLDLLQLVVLEERIDPTHREVVVADGPDEPVEVLAQLQELPGDDQAREAPGASLG